eukprot:469359-Rhodomonas_salina.1
MSGTELAYAATNLRLCYAMSSTDLASALTMCNGMCGTDMMYGTMNVLRDVRKYCLPTRCSVLASRLALEAYADTGYGYPPTGLLRDVRYWQNVCCYGLRACYAVCGTESMALLCAMRCPRIPTTYEDR